nr:NADH dehydrogenase subunit 4L [Ceraclea annulicornis]
MYFGFFISNLIFCIYRNYFLIMLMMLEFMVLNIFFMLNIFVWLMNLDFFILMIFLVVTVCEGVLGISIMVNMLRMGGIDYFRAFNSLM